MTTSYHLTRSFSKYGAGTIFANLNNSMGKTADGTTNISPFYQVKVDKILKASPIDDHQIKVQCGVTANFINTNTNSLDDMGAVSLIDILPNLDYLPVPELGKEIGLDDEDYYDLLSACMKWVTVPDIKVVVTDNLMTAQNSAQKSNQIFLTDNMGEASIDSATVNGSLKVMPSITDPEVIINYLREFDVNQEKLNDHEFAIKLANELINDSQAAKFSKLLTNAYKSAAPSLSEQFLAGIFYDFDNAVWFAPDTK